MKVVVTFLRKHGIRCVVYIDDLLFFHGTDVDKAIRERNFIDQLLCLLGLTVNYEKSILVPTTRIKYLGYIIDSILMKLFVPKEKIKDVVSFSRRLRRRLVCTVRILASFLGKISSMSHAILPWRLLTRTMKFEKDEVFKDFRDWEALVVPSEEAFRELELLIYFIQVHNGRSVRTPPPSWTTRSDSSGDAYGSTGSKNWICWEEWTEEERLNHNNYLETLASVRTIRRFVLEENVSDGVLCHETDNMTAVSYLNKQGGRIPKISKPVEAVWMFCLERNIEITGNHVSGLSLLDGVDFLSRMSTKQSEWRLPTVTFVQIADRWGPFSVDLFATQFNNQLPRFFAFWKDPKAEAIDAMIQQWNENPYAFPPFILIGRILAKILQEKVQIVTMVTPWWEGASWWPSIHRLAVEPPIILPSVLVDLKNNTQEIKWPLLAWRLSGIRSRSLVSMRTSWDWLKERGDNLPMLIPRGEFLDLGATITN